MTSITTVVPSTGSLHGGTQLKLVGTGFGADINDVGVTLVDSSDNQHVCNVINVEIHPDGTSELSCDVSDTMNDSTDTIYDLQLNDRKGTVTATKVNGFQTTHVATPLLTSVSPVHLSAAGLTRITICGSNSLRDNIHNTSIQIGGRSITDLRPSPTNNCIECLSPSTTIGTTKIILNVAPYGQAARNGSVVITVIDTPRIDSLESDMGSSGDVVVIHGVGFSTVPSENLVEIIGKNTKALAKCIPTSSTSIRIEVCSRLCCYSSFLIQFEICVLTFIHCFSSFFEQCTIATIQTQTQLDWYEENRLGNASSISVVVQDIGKASGRPTFQFQVFVDSISPQSGSLAGGDVLTIKGRGLMVLEEVPSVWKGSKHKTEMYVNVGDEQTSCEILTFNDTTIQCKMPRAPESCVPYNNTLRNCPVTFSDVVFQATEADELFYKYSGLLIPSLVGGKTINVSRGTNVTIHGTNWVDFDDTNTQPIVSVTMGGEMSRCALPTRSNTTNSTGARIEIFTVRCEAPLLYKGEHEVVLTVLGRGTAVLSNAQTPRIISYAMSIISIEPNMGSLKGGTRVVIHGDGFSPSLWKHPSGAVQDALIGGFLCGIQENGRRDRLECTTRATFSSPTAVAVTSTDLFQGDISRTPIVTSMTASNTTSHEWSLVGSKFGTDMFSINISIGWGEPCTILSMTDMTIDMACQPQTAGTHGLNLYRSGGYGFADIDTGIVPVQVDLIFKNMHPVDGSLAGGTLLTVSGAGFSRIDTENIVQLCGVDCDVVSSNATTITCLTGSALPAVDEDTVSNQNNGGRDAIAAIVHDYSILNSGDDIEETNDWLGVLVEDCLDVAIETYGDKVIASRNYLVRSSWNHVPPGCTVSHTGDFAAHWNDNTDSTADESHFVKVFLQEPIPYKNWTSSFNLNVGKNRLTLHFQNVVWDSTNKLDTASLILYAKQTNDMRLKVQVDVSSSSSSSIVYTNTSYWEPRSWPSVGDAYSVDLTNHFKELVHHPLWKSASNLVTIRLKRIEGNGQRNAVSFDTYQGK